MPRPPTTPSLPFRAHDALFERDGLTLSALEERLPMTRFGVMKHLRLVENAGLVVTRKVGREKLHFLNPIRLIYDRLVNKYTERWAVALTDLKRQLEEELMEPIHVPHQVPLVPSPECEGAMAVLEIYIKTTPERLWQAITDPRMRARYSFGVEIHSEWTPGSCYVTSVPDGPDHPEQQITEGENLEVDRPDGSCRASALCGATKKAAGLSRVTWEIIPVGDSAGSPSSTIACPGMHSPSFMAAGQWCFPASRPCWKGENCSQRLGRCSTCAGSRMRGDFQPMEKPIDRIKDQSRRRRYRGSYCFRVAETIRL